ncbi:MAG: hypothetical protein RL095_3256 [Verrucomicrobiota bacterium]|jgi:glycerol-3-phosphate dehydrogenase (NAD(P)+)
MKIAVITAGAFGSALSQVLCDNRHEVTLWGRNPEYMAEVASRRENFWHLPGYRLHDNLRISSDFAATIEDAELVLVTTPAQHLRGSLAELRRLGLQCPVVNVAKGIERSSLKRMAELAAEVLGPAHPYAMLAGPSHAEEVIQGMPAALVAAATDEELARLVQKAFMSPRFRVYTSTDVTGVELGGALKNIYAICAGVLDGLGFGDNTKAALMTRAVVEMGRLGEALGGRRETFAGLSGLGDLITTCTSQHSRNRRVGELLGKGATWDAIQADMGHNVAEGVPTAAAAAALAQRLGVKAPIIEACNLVLHHGACPREAILGLMTRDAKSE